MSHPPEGSRGTTRAVEWIEADPVREKRARDRHGGVFGGARWKMPLEARLPSMRRQG
jgi:hypothetical protein